MLTRIFGRGHQVTRDVLNTYHAPTSATVATKTLAADTLRRNVLHKIGWSYNADPTGGILTVTVGGVEKKKEYITKSGPGSLNVNIVSGVNESIVVALSSGGGGVSGSVYLEYTIEES